jgi:adenylosuccinate lyase
MATRLTDSPLYAHLWSTDELDAIVGERARLACWLEILAALARAQAALGIIPADAAREITQRATVEALDLDYVTEQTRQSSHSTLGLIRGLRRVLPEGARDYVYYGATVQDITDTWFAMMLRDVGAIVWREVRTLEERVLDLAQRHRGTVMVGRTHGQAGAPITFGFKAASWADELRRHVRRLAEGRSRWQVGQLAGAVGVLGFFGERAVPLRQRFCAELGLRDPGISWLTARDRIAEFGTLLAMVCATAARIGVEVYELQRGEIGELAEPTGPEAVGSITMPHKRNPETCEHLDTLARLARASAAVLLESMVGVHERDGRSWKAEWVALPEVCLLSGTALGMANDIVAGLEVHTEAMAANLRRAGDLLGSERMLAALSARLGRHRAQEVLQQALHSPGAAADPVGAVVATGAATAEEVRGWLTEPAVAGATAMVELVLARARSERSEEPAAWT